MLLYRSLECFSCRLFVTSLQVCFSQAAQTSNQDIRTKIYRLFYSSPLYLRVDGRRVKLLNCTDPCEQGYPRQVVENSPSDITAVCPEEKAEPVQLKFRDILVYSLRLDAFHQALCSSLKINYSPARRTEHENAWHLGDHSGTEVYLTYETSTLTDTINSIYLSQHKLFILMVPTAKNVTPKIQQFMAKNNSVLLSMADELHLQPDGSFKLVRGISECMKSCSSVCPQRYQSKILPIEAYKILFYSKS